MQTLSESATRRLARREGYLLRKSRSRDPDALAYGGYMLVDPDTNIAVLGGHPWVYSAELDDIEAYLAS